MKTYTEHKLTDAMLKRLSQMVHGKPHGHGVSLDALVKRGLAAPIEGAEYPKTHHATVAGEAALIQARRQGW